MCVCMTVCMHIYTYTLTHTHTQILKFTELPTLVKVVYNVFYIFHISQSIAI